jgi:hypothetical protein
MTITPPAHGFNGKHIKSVPSVRICHPVRFVDLALVLCKTLPTRHVPGGLARPSPRPARAAYPSLSPWATTRDPRTFGQRRCCRQGPSVCVADCDSDVHHGTSGSLGGLPNYEDQKAFQVRQSEFHTSPQATLLRAPGPLPLTLFSPIPPLAFSAPPTVGPSSPRPRLPPSAPHDHMLGIPSPVFFPSMVPLVTGVLPTHFPSPSLLSLLLPRPSFLLSHRLPLPSRRSATGAIHRN